MEPQIGDPMKANIGELYTVEISPWCYTVRGLVHMHMMHLRCIVLFKTTAFFNQQYFMLYSKFPKKVDLMLKILNNNNVDGRTGLWK
jgi:hypothetical protein